MRNKPGHDKTYSKTCVTSKDSDQPVHLSTMARVLGYPALDSLEAVGGIFADVHASESLLVAQVLL